MRRDLARSGRDKGQKRNRVAGYPVRGKVTPIIICEITTDAIRYLGHITNPTDEALLSAFDEHKDEIRKLASALFDGGAHRPQVTLKEVERADKLGLKISHGGRTQRKGAGSRLPARRGSRSLLPQPRSLTVGYPYFPAHCTKAD